MKATVYSHSLKFYDALIDHSRLEVLSGGLNLQVFRGSLTDVYNGLGIPKAYYSETIGVLKKHLCIEVIQRGSRTTESVVVLHRPPERMFFVRTGEDDLTDAEDFAKLVTEFEKFRETLGGVNIAEALVAIDRRFTEVEKQMQEIRKTIKESNNK